MWIRSAVVWRIANVSKKLTVCIFKFILPEIIMFRDPSIPDFEFESSVLRIFGSNKQWKATEEWKKLRNKGLVNLFSSPISITVDK